MHGVTWHRRVTAALALVTIASIFGTIGLALASPSPSHFLVAAAACLVGGVPAASAIAVARRDGHGVLPELLVMPGLFAAVVLLLSLASTVRARPWHAGLYITAASQGAWVLIYVLLALPLLFFPEGRPPTRLARWLVAVILVDAAVFMVAAATAPGPFLPPDEASPHVLGTMPEPVSTILVAVSLPLLPISLIGVVVYLTRRYRTVDDNQRHQLRWLSLAAGSLPGILLSTWASYALLGNADVVLAAGLTLGFAILPALIAIALCKPDLLDIDRTIVETLTRGSIAAVLLGVFTILNVLVADLLSRHEPAVAVVLTAAIAIAVAPAWHRLRRGIEARVYPVRHRVLAAVEDLRRDTLSGTAPPEQLQERLRAALHDPRLVVGYGTPTGNVIVDAHGTPIGSLPEAAGIYLGTQPIGVLSVDVPLASELVRDLALHCAPLVELVRLRLELRQALHEAKESRARLLRVGYEERSRLERDLHDGAQQRLVALGMALRLAQRHTPKDAPAHGVLDAAVAELSTAVSELRELAHGIRPSCLDDGLLPALSQLVSSSPLPISLRVTAEQLQPDVETTAYYVAAEAITNAVKHADARHITLEVELVEAHLHVRVRDDGRGAAAPREGSGLAGLADRVTAHGGSLAVDSHDGAGTLVEAVLPCAS